VALLVLVLSAAVPGVRAQQDTLSGIVWLDGDPMTDVTVLLHAVSSSEAGEVDSIRVDAEGRFRFSLPEPLDDIQRNQIYFAWQNIPFPFYPVQMVASSIGGLLHGVKGGHMFTSLRGLAEGWGHCLSGRIPRRPVRHPGYGTPHCPWR